MALAAAHQALDALAGADLNSATSDELLAAMRELERLRRRLPTVEHALIAETESRGLPYESGCRNTAQFLRGLLRLDPSEAWGRVRAADATGVHRTLSGERLAPAYPAVAAAQAAGDISERHARIVVDTVENLPDEPRHEHGAALEEELVRRAVEFDPRQLGKLAQRVRACYDPDGPVPDVAYRERSRFLDVRQRVDGSAQVHGELTAECAERMLVLFDALAAPRPETDGIRDERNAGQRRHDALLDALGTVQRADLLPSTGGVSATIVITMSNEAYRTGCGLATTAHGALIPAKDALRWAGGDLQLLGVVIDRMRGITAYSSKQRLFSPQQRLVMAARDGGCTFPGCEAPPGWCQVHHLREHATGGSTSVDNGALVCGSDHRERIKQGWEARLIDGRVGWVPPRWIDPERRPRFNDLHRPWEAA